jgi:hypothetical protein
LAAAENALEGPGLAAFATALNERARLILEERVRGLERELAWRRETIAGLEEKVLALEKEDSWRRETIAGLEEKVLALEKEDSWRRETTTSLEQEISWRRETTAGIEEQVLALEQEISWQRETTARLEEQTTQLRVEGQMASQAHDKLLAHHRQMLELVRTELDAVASLPLTRLRQARRRLQALVELLRAELS